MIISPEDRRARARAELRRGAPVALVVDDAAALILAAETLTERMFQALRAAAETQAAGGPISLALSDRRAAALKARAYDGDLARIRLRPDQSTADILAIADPARSLERPLTGPHLTERDGDARAHRAALRLCARAMLLPAALVLPLRSTDAAERLALDEEIALVRLKAEFEEPGSEWREASHARVPIDGAPDAILRIFRKVGWDDEHYVLEIGAPKRSEPVLTRLHSACATGDIFGSLKCDCGPQLHAAIKRIDGLHHPEIDRRDVESSIGKGPR